MMEQDEKIYDEAISSINQLIYCCKPQTSSEILHDIVAVFTSGIQQSLRFSGCIGLLHLDIDRTLKTYMLRLYDIESLRLLFEVELYFGFADNYRAIRETVYAFDYFADGLIAFQFKNKQKADIFHSKILQIAPKISKLKEILKETLKF